MHFSAENKDYGKLSPTGPGDRNRDTAPALAWCAVVDDGSARGLRPFIPSERPGPPTPPKNITQNITATSRLESRLERPAIGNAAAAPAFRLCVRHKTKLLHAVPGSPPTSRLWGDRVPIGRAGEAPSAFCKSDSKYSNPIPAASWQVASRVRRRAPRLWYIHAMEYRGVEYAVPARPRRDEWLWTIYPTGAPAFGRQLTGTRDRAVAQARRAIDLWIARQAPSGQSE